MIILPKTICCTEHNLPHLVHCSGPLPICSWNKVLSLFSCTPFFPLTIDFNIYVERLLFLNVTCNCSILFWNWLRKRAFVIWAFCRLQWNDFRVMESYPLLEVLDAYHFFFFIFSPYDIIEIPVICQGILLHLWLNCGVSTQCGCFVWFEKKFKIYNPYVK